MDAGFDFEEGDGLVENFRREVGNLHDLLASAGASSEGLENFGFDIGIADEVLPLEVFMLCNIILREKLAEDVARLGVGKGTLPDKLVAALGIGTSDVSRDGEDVLALI